MIEKIAFSPKAKKISGILLLIGAILIVVSAVLPMTLENKEIGVLADKSLAVAETISAMVSEAYPRELDYVRSNTNTNTEQYKKLSNLFSKTIDANNASRIFAVYKGVGGKYYIMLDTYNSMDVIGEAVNEKYYQKYKSMWDKISSGKIYSDYNMNLMDNEWGKSVIAWSALKNSDGKVIAVLGVQNSLSNKEFNTFSLIGVYVILIISAFCFIFSVISFILGIRIFKACRKIHKGSEKEYFNNGKEKHTGLKKNVLKLEKSQSAEKKIDENPQTLDLINQEEEENQENDDGSQNEEK